MFMNGRKFRRDVHMALQMNSGLFKITSADSEPGWNKE